MSSPPTSEPSGLLVTGCYRSGTTLTEKLIHAHPEVHVASQPCPILWHDAKTRFLAERGLDRRYPLEHQFRETAYEPAQFAAFLDTYTLDQRAIDELFQRLRAYDEGLWTPEVLELHERIGTGRFLDVLSQILRALAPPGRRIVGSKEILVEEYIPYLLGRGWYVTLVVRDPRDVIASLDYRERDNATGDHRPLLYSLRSWRKSVAHALTHAGDPRMLVLRYEDLTLDPDGQLERVRQRLDLAPFPSLTELRDQRGQPWHGNSSFEDLSHVSSAPVGRHENLLPESARAYIQTVCGPEMRVFGYDVETPADPEAALVGYHEPFGVIHRRFTGDYSTRPDHIAEELRRLELLEGAAPSPQEQREWFLTEEAYDGLRRGIRHSRGRDT